MHNDSAYKLAQLIIQRIDGNRLSDSSYTAWIEDCTKRGCGGFIIFGGRREPVRDFIRHIQSLTKYTLFIASDIECGIARQIEGTTRFPCQMALAASVYPDNKGLLIDMLETVADECLYMGINMPLIPVLDVNSNPNNPIISTRAFSDSPQIVSWFVKSYIEVFSSRGLIIAGKHFPGHGDTDIDSHIDMPIIKKSLQELWRCELIPFAEAISQGIPCIMAGHLKVPQIDDILPSSISSAIIKGLLRDEMGFNGLVITDAMNMDALRGYKDIYAACLNAGVDLILHPNSFDQCLASLLDSYHQGIITDHKIEKAYQRVSEFRKALPYGRSSIDSELNNQMAWSIYKRMVTLIKSESDVLPLNPDICRLFLSGDYSRYNTEMLEASFENISYPDDSACPDEDTAVIALFTTVAAWHGSSGISPEDSERISNIIKDARSSVVVSFGSPYVLRDFPDANVLIAAYEPTVEAQINVVKCLFGRQSFNHNLPVKSLLAMSKTL